MSETIRSGVVKTRKPHHCWGCTIEIPTGTLVDSQTFEDMGQVTTVYFCDICSEIQSEDNGGCCYGDWQEEAEARRAAFHPQPGESAMEKKETELLSDSEIEILEKLARDRENQSEWQEGEKEGV